jgi:hypothetical protein
MIDFARTGGAAQTKARRRPPPVHKPADISPAGEPSAIGATLRSSSCDAGLKPTISDLAAVTGKSKTSVVTALHRLRDAGTAESPLEGNL